MVAPIQRVNNGSTFAKTGANAIASAAYCNSADTLRLQQSAMDAPYGLCDFRLTGVNYATAPVAGALQIAIIDRDFGGTQGPTPATSMLPGRVYTLSPTPFTSNAVKIWVMGVNGIQLSMDQDVWLFNNGTGQSLPVSWILTAQPWTWGS